VSQVAQGSSDSEEVSEQRTAILTSNNSSACAELQFIQEYRVESQTVIIRRPGILVHGVKSRETEKIEFHSSVRATDDRTSHNLRANCVQPYRRIPEKMGYVRSRFSEAWTSADVPELFVKSRPLVFIGGY
jgi:hypothetical protein